MSVMTTSRKMTSREQTAYDLGFHEGMNAAIRHGRWIHVPSSDMMTGKAYKCSECNKMRYGSYMPNYCQCCGAKMDGDG